MAARYSHGTGTIRFSEDDDFYEKRKPFDGVASVMWIDDHTAVLHAALGKGSGLRIIEAVECVKVLGAKVVRVKRAKNHHMPKPWQLVEIGKIEDVWELVL